MRCLGISDVGQKETVDPDRFPVPCVTMKYAPKVVLHCPAGYRMKLDSLVEQFLACGVKFVGVVGEDCE